MSTPLKILFHAGELPTGYKIVSYPFLYNTREHRLGQSLNGWISFYVLHTDKMQVWGEVHFCVEMNVAVSPVKAPFGSFHFHDSLPVENRFRFVQWVEDELKRQQIQKIRLKNAPALYAASSTAVLEVLLHNLNYKVAGAEIGAVLPVASTKFSMFINAWEKRKLNQSKRARLKFLKLPVAQFESVYRFIAQCRAEREQTISMTWDELNAAAHQSSGHFFAFGVFKEKELVAASIAVNVGHHVLYTFYYAHARAYDSLSPVVFLMEGIYNWSKKHKYQFIDLGTSSLHGIPNFPLLDFKIHLGARLCQKLTFEKMLSR